MNQWGFTTKDQGERLGGEGVSVGNLRDKFLPKILTDLKSRPEQPDITWGIVGNEEFYQLSKVI